MTKFSKTKKAGILLVFFLVLSAVIFHRQLIALAQFVADSFNDQTKIAATWNISTSTPGELKLADKSCDIFNWFCSASTTCANTLGDGDYIIVKQGDANSSLAWKTANTACNQPHCSINGGQNGDNLKADNTLNFSNYPARNYCKSIGGRLPTITELQCIYANRASFGSFGSGNYWSSTEDSGTYARNVNFTDGSVNDNSKTGMSYVRCVKGW
mgnify:CR=1 FL=1